MEVIKTAIDGVLILEPRIFKDARGYFFESFSSREFEEKVCKTTFVQDNESFSGYGVVRGLHFQKPPFTQSKIVRVIKGSVLDVAVDIRKRFSNIRPACGSGINRRKPSAVIYTKRICSCFAVLSDESYSNINAITFMLRKAKEESHGTTPI